MFIEKRQLISYISNKTYRIKVSEYYDNDLQTLSMDAENIVFCMADLTCGTVNGQFQHII
jgi:hypothetical protein